MNEGARNQAVLHLRTFSSKVICARSRLLLSDVGQVEVLAPEDALAAVEHPRPHRQVVPFLQLVQVKVGRTRALLARLWIFEVVFTKLDLQDFVDRVDIGATGSLTLDFVSEPAEIHPELDVAAEVFHSC